MEDLPPPASATAQAELAPTGDGGHRTDRFSRLPAELLDRIFLFVHAQGPTPLTCLLSRSLLPFARKQLYRHALLSTSATAQMFVRSILAAPSLGLDVRSLRFEFPDWTGVGPRGEVVLFDDEDDAHESDKFWLALSRARSIAISGHCDEAIVLVGSLLSVAWGEGVPRLSRLEEVELVGSMRRSLTPLAYDNLLRVAPNVKKLTLDGVGYGLSPNSPEPGRFAGFGQDEPVDSSSWPIEELKLQGRTTAYAGQAGSFFRTIPALRKLELEISLQVGDVSALVNNLGLPDLSEFRLAFDYKRGETRTRGPIDPDLEVDLKRLMPSLTTLHLDVRAKTDPALGHLPAGLETLYLGRHQQASLATLALLLQQGSAAHLPALKSITFDYRPPGMKLGKLGRPLLPHSTPLALPVDEDGQPTFDPSSEGWERPTWTEDYPLQGVRDLAALAKSRGLELRGYVFRAVGVEEGCVREEGVRNGLRDRWEEGELGREWVALPRQVE